MVLVNNPTLLMSILIFLILQLQTQVEIKTQVMNVLNSYYSLLKGLDTYMDCLTHVCKV